MGIFDKIQDAAAQYAAQQNAESDAALAAAFPPGTVIPRRDVVRISPRFRHATLQAYLVTLGMLPEDCYAVVPQQNNDVTVAYEVIYRDRPEYEAGRASWAAGGS